MTNEKNQIPQNWIRTSIEHVSEIIRGISFPKNARVQSPRDGYIACLRTKNVQDEVDWSSLWFIPKKLAKNQEKIVRKGDILISNSNSLKLVGKVAQVRKLEHPATLGAFISLIRVNEKINKSFIYYQLCSYEMQSNFKKIASTTTNISNISTSKIKKSPIYLAPFNEQNLIVFKIEELLTKLDAGVNSLQKVKAQWQQYRQAVLKYAFSGELTEEWRRTHKDMIIPASTLLERIKTERNNNSSRTKSEKLLPIDSSTLPIIPEKWTWVRTADICKGIVPGRDKPKDFKGDIPWITLPDVDELYISRSKKNLGLTKEDAEKVGMKVMPKGTVLMSCVGRFGIICIAGCPVVPNQQFHGFICSDNIRPEYVAFSLMAQIKQMKELSSATTIAYLNKTKCNSITLPLAPIAEQHRIVEEIEQRFSTADEIEKTALNCIKQSERLRESILKIAFEGKLVAQDFLDEPAEKLLERIKKEKKERNSQQKTTKRKKSKTKQRRLDGYVE